MLFSMRYFTAPERSTNKGEHHGSVCTSGDALLPKKQQRETQTPPRRCGEWW